MVRDPVVTRQDGPAVSYVVPAEHRVPAPEADGAATTGREADPAVAVLVTVVVDRSTGTRSQRRISTLAPGARRSSAPKVSTTPPASAVTTGAGSGLAAPPGPSTTTTSCPPGAPSRTSEPFSGSRSVTTRPVRSAACGPVAALV